MWELSDRLKRLPPYLFAEIDRKKSELRKKKVKFIDLSIGDPDIEAPLGMLKTLAATSKKKKTRSMLLIRVRINFAGLLRNGLGKDLQFL